MTHRLRATALASLLFLAACGGNDLPKAGVIQLSDAFVADFNLVDHNGAPASDETYEGTPLFMYFGFASCPDVCPAALSVMSASLDELGRDAQGIQPLFVTVDPERDTADVLKAHLAFDGRILGLTGSQQEIDTTLKNLRVFAKKVELPDSALGYTMDHQSLFYIIDAEGNAVLALNDRMAPADIAQVLKDFIN